MTQSIYRVFPFKKWCIFPWNSIVLEPFSLIFHDFPRGYPVPHDGTSWVATPMTSPSRLTRSRTIWDQPPAWQPRSMTTDLLAELPALGVVFLDVFRCFVAFLHNFLLNEVKVIPKYLIGFCRFDTTSWEVHVVCVNRMSFLLDMIDLHNSLIPYHLNFLHSSTNSNCFI